MLTMNERLRNVLNRQLQADAREKCVICPRFIEIL